MGLRPRWGKILTLPIASLMPAKTWFIRAGFVGGN
jgi:hypothetical protein